MDFSNVTVAIAGLGGLGGHIAEQLARLGVGRLVCIDFDTVDESNLNRQLFATCETVGELKTKAAYDRLKSVNPTVEIVIHNERLTSENAAGLLKGCHIVMDALDNVESRFALQDACALLELPLVHGAVSDDYGQVCLIMPGDDTLRTLYSHSKSKNLVTLAFAPVLVASYQTAVCYNYIKNNNLHKVLMRIDMKTLKTELLEIG